MNIVNGNLRKQKALLFNSLENIMMQSKNNCVNNNRIIKINIIKILILQRFNIIIITENRLGKKPYTTICMGGLFFKFQLIDPIKTIIIKL